MPCMCLCAWSRSSTPTRAASHSFRLQKLTAGSMNTAMSQLQVLHELVKTHVTNLQIALHNSIKRLLLAHLAVHEIGPLQGILSNSLGRHTLIPRMLHGDACLHGSAWQGSAVTKPQLQCNELCLIQSTGHRADCIGCCARSRCATF